MKIMFEPTNSTEAGCDYVKFYKDSNYSEYYGSEKYSGGRQGSSSNFPTSVNPLKYPVISALFIFIRIYQIMIGVIK
jgi:hypothetical protein